MLRTFRSIWWYQSVTYKPIVVTLNQPTDHSYQNQRHRKYSILRDLVVNGTEHLFLYERYTKISKLFYFVIDVGNVYTKWSEWSPCDRTDCTKRRQRFCSEYSMAKCPEANSFGVHTETVKCTTSECNGMTLFELLSLLQSV